MSAFAVVAMLITLAAVLSWANYRFVRLPRTIGVMVLSLTLSLGLVGAGGALPGLIEPLRRALVGIDFNAALLNGMLGALLFAGALHININDLTAQRGVIGTLATVGVLVSTLVIGTGVWLLSRWLHLGVSPAYCMLFGALISPTDPIAIGAILLQLGVPKSLETKITGESLFNDGVGVVVFLAVLGIAAGGDEVSAGHVFELFAMEAVGGILYGAVLGWVAYRMLRSVDNYQVEILITLALVTGGYAASHALHVSGPLAMVVAGLLIGNHGRAFAMSERTRNRLDDFWELVDDFLNTMLFVMIGVEVLVLEYSPRLFIAGLAIVPLVLAARFVSVGMPVTVMRRWRTFTPHAVKILTWSGLRGGISVALALGLPAGRERATLIAVTYVVVTFSIVVQGLSIGRVTRRLLAR
jgi:CPA1 family monovalent cation:H+ antiporter